MATNIPFDDYLDEPLKDTEFKADVAAESTKLEIAVALTNARERARLAQSEWQNTRMCYRQRLRGLKWAEYQL
ncbi:hypothetical protein [Lactiplantibacillus pentosus]